MIDKEAITLSEINRVLEKELKIFILSLNKYFIEIFERKLKGRKTKFWKDAKTENNLN